MSGIIAVLAVLSLVALVGWIMVLVAAFRASVLWGIGSLLLFPVWLVFGIVHWQEAKKGFLIYLGSTALVVAVAFLSGGAALLQRMPGTDETAMQRQGEEELAGAAESEEVAAGQQGESVTYETGSSTRAGESATASDETSESEEKRIAYSYQDVDLNEFSSAFVGTPVIVTTLDGRTHKGTIVAVIPHRLTIRKKVGTGTFEFDLDHKRIERVQVLRPESR